MTNLVEGFTQRWLDRDRFVTKASEVYTVHEMEAAEVWANKNGTNRNLAFEQWWPHDDGDGDGNAPPQPQWASQMEVWGNYYTILLIFPGTGPGGMCEVFLGVVDVACGDAHEVATQLECILLSWIPDRDWWAKRVVTFAVDGASNLGVRGASARQVVDVSIIESNVFALIGKWLVLMTPLG